MTGVRSLVVAAGGGGDAITGVALRRILRLCDEPVVMTYSWDRLMVDPLPGPRSIGDFVELDEVAPHVHRVVATTTPRSPAGSSLPRLATELPVRLLLLDPTFGTAGVAEQIDAAVRHYELDDIVVVDVGGDIVTDGRDPGLRSPLADQLALAGALETDLSVRLVVTGAGLDGEIAADTVRARLAEAGGTELDRLDVRDVDVVRHVFRWHPSEASGLLAAAADGHVGVVEVRDAGDQVRLSDEVTTVHSADARVVAARTPASALAGTADLSTAERIIAELTGISEIRHERSKAARLRHRRSHRPSNGDLTRIDACAAAAGDRGSDYVSLRRLAELLGASTLDDFTAMTSLLAQARPEHCLPSVYRVMAAASPTTTARRR